MSEIKTLKDKVLDCLDDLETGIFIGYRKDGNLCFITHTKDSPSKLGLIHFALLLCEHDASNQIKVRDEALQKLINKYEKVGFPE